MGDRTAANVGFVCAGVALVVALLQWTGPQRTLVAGVAGVAFVAFALRRYGRVDRSWLAPLVWIAGIGLVILSSPASVSPLSGPEAEGWVLIVTAVAGVLIVLAGYADWRGVGRARLLQVSGATARAAAIGIAGLLAIFVWAAFIGLFARSLAAGSLGSETRTVLVTLAGGLGTGSVALFYLWSTARGFDFLDLRWPTGRELAYAIGGVGAIIVLNVLLSVALLEFGLESASHSIVRSAQSNPTVLLLLIPLSFLIIGPGEELLYRNVVQKSLYATFSRSGAVVIASLIFAGVHFFAFPDPTGNVLPTVTTLGLVFALSLVLGSVYARTDNVAVPALVHGAFNAIGFGVEYVDLTQMMSTAFLWVA